MHVADRRALYTLCGRAAYLVDWTTPTSAAIKHEIGFCKRCLAKLQKTGLH